MPDTKITALAAITTVDPAADVLPIVDISDTSMAASGTTKKITTNQILGSGGTATLASATVTGALGAAGLNVTGATIPANGVYLGSANNLSFSAASALGMTLNSTGLGVGVASPAVKGHFYSASGSNGVRLQTGSTTAGDTNRLSFQNASGAADARTGCIEWYDVSTFKGDVRFLKAGGIQIRNSADSPTFNLDDTGNVGIGVTPSAWAAGYKGLQLKDSYAGLFANTSSGISELVSNAYNDGAWKFANAGNGAARYQMDALNRTHAWFYAATSANPITWTQAMTLAANGQLLLGTSTTDGAIDIGMVLNKPSATGFVGNSYQLNGSSKAFTYISSSAGAFRVDTVTGYTINMISATNGVYLANGGTSWTALSDERFKDIIEPISNAVAKVGSIRSVIGKFKTESEGTRRSFLIAQDVQAVLPEAVDASNPDQLGVAYTEVIPLLVAAIKELAARVQTLETR